MCQWGCRDFQPPGQLDISSSSLREFCVFVSVSWTIAPEAESSTVSTHGNSSFCFQMYVCVGGGGVTKPTFMYVSLACVWLAPDFVWTENTEPQPAWELKGGCHLSLELSGF